MKSDTTTAGPTGFSEEELLRYQRQLIMPGIGMEGQMKIKGARVFIAGLGGLGSISSCYLAAAGVGYMRIIDGDRVDTGNLNRQILHWTGDVGVAKTSSVLAKLSRLNPHCHIDAVEQMIEKDNIMDLLGDCHLIVDATDNLPTRRILNRASLSRGIPMIYGGVDGFNGMVTTFVPGQTPCFECIFGGIQPKERVVGVSGPVPGTIASIQALEALKLIVGAGTPLKGRLLFLSGLDMTFKEIEIERNPECPVCSKNLEA
jgi:molybdopterin/thiamine biosynthesis adenylyltransferase